MVGRLTYKHSAAADSQFSLNDAVAGQNRVTVTGATAEPSLRVKVKPTGSPFAPPASLEEAIATPSLVTLKNMASRLNAFPAVSVRLESPIATMTPYDWWRRTKEETLSHPMPDPAFLIRGAGKPTPVWSWPAIISWYIRYSKWPRPR